MRNLVFNVYILNRIRTGAAFAACCLPVAAQSRGQRVSWIDDISYSVFGLNDAQK